MKRLSFGAELELADVDCSRPIPSDIGAWECGDKMNENGFYLGKETCIMNSDGTVVDPDKIRCTKGGEVHVVPSYSIDTLIERIGKIFELFPEAKMFLPGKMHIHVGIQDWDLEDVKNLYRYTKENDVDLMDAMCSHRFMDKLLNDTNLTQDLRNHYLSSRRTVHNPKCFEKIEDFDTLKEVKYWWGVKCLYHFPKPTIIYKDIVNDLTEISKLGKLHDMLSKDVVVEKDAPVYTTKFQNPDFEIIKKFNKKIKIIFFVF